MNKLSIVVSGSTKISDSEAKSSSTASSLSTAAIMNIVDKLKFGRNRSTTRTAYYNVWRIFNQFFIRLDTKPRSWEERLVLFVGYLIERKRKSSTIKSYISAIKSVLKEDGEELNEDTFLLTSLTRACKYQNDQVHTLLLIRKGLVNLLFESIPKIFGSQQPYLVCLYRAMIVTAYFGLFRIGEITESNHTIKAKDVHIGRNKNKLMFILHTSKTHWTNVNPQIVKICGSPQPQAARHAYQAPFKYELCPFRVLKEYIGQRASRNSDLEQFFIFGDGEPVKPNHLHAVLKKALKIVGLNPKNYSVHGFRAGRMCDMVYNLKLPISVVQKLGRWRSGAIYKYLKQ